MKARASHSSFVKSFSRTSAMVESFNKAGIRATEGTLRLESALSTSASYTFQVNANQSQIVTEIRLRQGDVFIATAIGMYLKKATGATPTDAQQTTAALHTFPNSTVFTGASEATNLQSIYNSKLQFQVNSTNLTETLDTRRYYRVGEAQQGLAVSTAASNNTYFASQWNVADYGMMTFHQTIALNGQANNTINLLLPAGVDCSGTSSTNYAVIYLKGVLLINAAKQVEDKSIYNFASR
jgi:hypothetical protein